MEAIRILLVEDNEGDIILTKEALNDIKLINSVSVVRDGQKAIHYLEKKDEFQEVDEPDLILLDINLPKKNGHEVLMHIKNNEKFKSIPVIMLTTSSSDLDIRKAYKEYVNCYIVKPVDASNFMEVIAKIEDFWLSIVKLPAKE